MLLIKPLFTKLSNRALTSFTLVTISLLINNLEAIAVGLLNIFSNSFGIVAWSTSISSPVGVLIVSSSVVVTTCANLS